MKRLGGGEDVVSWVLNTAKDLRFVDLTKSRLDLVNTGKYFGRKLATMRTRKLKMTKEVNK